MDAGNKMKWVRAAISLLFCIAIIAGFLLKFISSETFMAVAMVAITWWYRSRDVEKSEK